MKSNRNRRYEMRDGILKPFHSLLAIFAVLIACQPVNAQQSLQWKFAEGDSFNVSLTQTSRITSYLTLADIEDQNKTGRTATNSIVLDLEWSVESVADDIATVRQKINRIRLEVDNGATSGTRTLNIDTDSQEKLRGIAKNLHEQMSALTGLTFDVLMKPNGEITDVEIPDETAEALRNIPGSSIVRGMMSEDSLTELYGQAAVVIPDDGGVDEGDSWQVTSELQSAAGLMNRTNVYTYEGTVKQDDTQLHRISVATTLQPAADSEPATDDSNAGGDEPGDSSEQKPAVRILEFAGEGNILMNAEQGNYTFSTISNRLKSENDYFDKTIVTTVESTVEMNVTRN